MPNRLTPDLNKALPFDEFAERAILGAMLIDNRYVNEVFSSINSDDFYSESHKSVAAAIDNLVNKGQGADTVTVSGYLKKKDELKFAGGYEYINSLIDGIPENINLGEYIKVVRDQSALRKIIITSMGVIQKGVDQKADTESILNELQEDIIKISGSRVLGGFLSTKELVPETVNLIEKIQKHGESRGLKTGFTDLDNITSGFQKANLIVIAARPSMGKTALALNITANMAIENEKSVGFFSIEMSKTQVMMRLLALKSRISLSALMSARPRLSQKEWKQLELAASELEKARIHIDDSPTLSIVEMKTRARRLKNERDLDIIFVDYLQLMKVTGDLLRKNDTRAQEVTIITSALKELAKELDIPVVACAQLSRAPEQRGTRREGPRYQLSDLKESGAIEQDADLVMFLHREREDQTDGGSGGGSGTADVIVAKQRNGPTGKIVLAFIDKYTKFSNYDWQYEE
ncbi:MAG: replicative DNA helicase [Candidatus Aminicenantes bacterium]|nr:replicative DNA helicase [Candidatus Aminicenantes bacterium]